MKRLVVLALSVLVLALASAALAVPPTAPPGQGECEHGNSGQECKPDPQPDHGQECEEHGNQGGVNEDHCQPATPDPSPTPTPDPTPDPEVVVDPPAVDDGQDQIRDLMDVQNKARSHPPRLARTGLTETLAVIGFGFLLVGFMLLLVPLVFMDATKGRRCQ